jgi:hypothetical protein
MIRSKIAMGLLWGLLALALHVVPGVVGPAHAQGSRKDDIVFNSRGVPLAGATIRVCAMPATGQPCTPLALIYSDAALTQALANPTTSDGLGNYHFYAAPGKYMIEISGPTITTKQIPDVLISPDPSSPNFPGNITAFSLTLSGNLTVNGNTTVLGNLASGTLNLTNQSTPPGSASAGTVNLYTKTADKRVYYKDETGTEIGPLGPGNGAQTNVSNTFTAPQNIDADFRTKGPNPWYDISRYGSYANGFPFAPTTTGSITSASSTLTTAGAFDVVNGQYVTVYGAGPAATIYTPGAAVPVSTITVSSNVATLAVGTDWACSAAQNITIAGSSDAAFNGTFTPVTNTGANGCTFNITHANCNPCTIGGSTTVVGSPPFLTSVQGILNGATTYNYKIVAEDMFGGLSAASAPITITNGAATLGPNSAVIAANGCSRTLAGLTTITTTAAHNFQVGVPVLIVSGSTGDSSFEGQAVINTTPTSTTFTFFQYGAPPKTNACTGGTVKVVARNVIRWNQRFTTIIGHWIYRCTGAACSNYTLVGHSDGVDGAFIDYGLTGGLPNAPGYVPQGVPPASPTNQWLSAKVNSGGGTSTLTLSVAASNTVSSSTVLHDNTPAILAVCTAMGGASGAGGTIYIPDAGGNVYPVTTILDMRPTCPKTIRILQAGRISTTASLIPQQGNDWEGAPQGGGGAFVSFSGKYQAQIIGNAYPQIFQTGTTAVQATFENLNVQCNRAYQGCYFQDDTWSAGTNMTFRNFSAGGIPGCFPVRFGGQFFYVFDTVFFSNGAGIANWGVPEPFLNTIAFGIGNGPQSLGSNVTLKTATFAGGGMVFDSQGQNIGGLASIKCVDCLLESAITPFMRFSTANSNFSGASLHVEFMSFADSAGGGAMPMIDFANSGPFTDVKVYGASCANGGAPLFAMGVNPSVISQIDVSGTSACVIGAPQAVVSASGSFGTVGVTTSGTGSLSYLMPVPSAPSVAVASGGSIPVGTYYYSILAIDTQGRTTTLSPPTTTPCTTTSGNQSCVVSWTLVPGQVGTRICRGASPLGVLCDDAAGLAAFNVAGTSFTDTNVSVSYTVSSPLGSTAASASLSSVSIVGPQVQLTNSGFTDTIGGTFTATRTQTLPDTSGIVPVTSYLNSAYDNATRGNGAIGSNWTIQQNGLNIASNQIQGSVGGQSNAGLWNANSFSTSQFAQATVTALNGTSDFPGVTVLASGTGASSTYYDCVENTTTIFIQRVVNSGTTNLTNSASTGAVGDLLRLEVAPGGALTCYKNGAIALTATDTQITSGLPGLLISGSLATEKNWSGGNLHPLGQLDIEQDWTKTQHFTQGVAFGTESFAASPRAEQNVFLPGALTVTWTGATWTTDKAVTITRVQVQAKTAPAGCTTNAVVRLTDGTTPVNVTISAAANDSGATSQNYAAGSSLQVLVQTAATGCTTSPADANVTVQYRMQ